jgi:hypothetical protein
MAPDRMDPDRMAPDKRPKAASTRRIKFIRPSRPSGARLAA